MFQLTGLHCVTWFNSQANIPQWGDAAYPLSPYTYIPLYRDVLKQALPQEQGLRAAHARTV